MSVTIRDNAQILYSTEALNKAAKRIGVLEVGDNTVTVQRIEDRIILDLAASRD